MIALGKTMKTKRGNPYRARSTRLATGYAKVLADSKKRYLEYDDKYKIILALSVRGSTDELHGIRYRTKIDTKHHPQDPSYTKKVIILNDSGRQYLKGLRGRRERKKCTSVIMRQKRKRIFMFDFERLAATKQLNNREVSFKKCHGHYSPDKIIDRHTLTLAGFKKTAGDEAWFDALIDSEEFGKHFSTHTVYDHDDIN